MSHLRTQIRDAVAAAVTGLPTTGARVRVGHWRPTDDLPGLWVRLDNEVIKRTSQTLWERSADCFISILVKGGADPDATADQALLEVENAITAAGTIAGMLPAGLILREVVSMRDNLETSLTVLETVWQATYYTYSAAPDTPA